MFLPWRIARPKHTVGRMSSTHTVSTVCTYFLIVLYQIEALGLLTPRSSFLVWHKYPICHSAVCCTDLLQGDVAMVYHTIRLMMRFLNYHYEYQEYEWTVFCKWWEGLGRFQESVGSEEMVVLLLYGTVLYWSHILYQSTAIYHKCCVKSCCLWLSIWLNKKI